MTRIGATVDRFRILEQIGRGGMGEVYVAHDEVLGRNVALKSIRAEYRLNAEARVRFMREARALSQLGHPHICQIYDYIEGADADYLVLELIDGRSLTRAIREGLSEKQKLKIAEQIAGVLVAAHEKGLVHRDLKPDNVMLADGDAVKVLDFGLSRSITDPAILTLGPASSGALSFSTSGEATHALTPDDAQTRAITTSDDSSRGVTSMGAIVGTLGHMSPEQARGETATAASDLYSFGLLLQELFTGKAAYPEALDKVTLLARAQRGETAPVHGLDPDLAKLIRRLTSLAPEARPSASDALDRIVWIATRPQRRRRALGLAAVIAALVVFGIAMTIQTIRARRAERAAEVEAARANREAEASKNVSEFLLGIFRVSDPGEARGNSVTARELLDKGAERINGDLEAQPEVRAKLMDTIGSVYMKLGLYPQAEPMFRSGLAIRRKALGNLHPDVATSLQNLGILCWSKGEYPEAESLFREAIAIREKVLGPDSLDLAKSLNNLAIVYKTEGKYALAEPLYVRSFHIVEKSVGPDHPDLGSSLNNLASFYYSQKKYAQAEPLLRRSLAIKEKSLGPDHPDVASSLNNVAEVLVDLKRYPEAETLYARSLAIREKVFGPKHPDVAESLTNIGALDLVEGKPAEAEPLLLRSLAIREEMLGRDHPDFASTLAQIGTLRRDQRRFDEAAKLYAQAAAILEKAEDPMLSSVLEEHASMLRSLGRNAEAERLETRAKALE